VFCLLLMGCGVVPTASVQTRQIIVLWHTFTGPEAAALETLTDRFNVENLEGIVVVTEYQEGLLTKLRVDPDRRPDLVTVRPEEMQTILDLGLVGVVPSASPEMRRVWADFLPMAGALYQVGGVPQALPLGLATYLAFSNADWLADLGYDADEATWEDLRRTACAATDPLRGQVGLGVPARASLLLAMLAASGSRIVGEDGYYQFSDTAGYQTAMLVQEVLSGNCGVLYEDREAGVSRLSRSSMAIIIESSESLRDIELAILTGRNFQLSITPLAGPDGPGPTLWYGPGLLISAQDPDRQEAALTVMHWLFSPEAQSTWGEATEYVPIRRSVVEAALQAETSGSAVGRARTGDGFWPAPTWALALEAADSGAWVAWPQPTNRITCRASLLRGLLALQDESADARAYIDTAVTACNTGVTSWRTDQ
jgi:ABC-type glycerol-3-phosphate transport system substrate-binding protein